MKKYKGLILIISLLLMTVLCYVGLFLLASRYELDIFLVILFQILGLIFVLPLFVAFHEGGHMVFGLISGYSLLSYKVGPFEWYKKDERIGFRVNPLSGVVLGQCLMLPPKPKKKVKPRFFLYNAGGLIFSYLMDIVLIVLFFIIDDGYVKFLLTPMISISLFLTANNSIYTKGGINDVCNHIMVKNNPKYINSIMYQLEMVGNISKGKRYGAKTLYEPYFDNNLNHITLAVCQLRFLQVVDKDDIEEIKRISNIIKNNYHKIPMPLQRVSIIFSILYTDIVINENMRDFKRHFKWITDKEKMICMKLNYDVKYYYNIYNMINDGDYKIENEINELVESDILGEGEKLSVKKMMDNLTNKLQFYKENGNSFVIKE